MKAINTTQTKIQHHTKDEQAAQVGMGIIVAFSLLCGLWGTACFFGAMAQNGIVNMALGYGRAIIGG